jgi:membrane protease subunit (stomatin/prohibitin family)
VKRHFHHGRATRVGKGLIPGITYDFEGKQKTIKAHHEKMVGSARDSFQELSTNFYEEWRGSRSEAHESMQALKMGMDFIQKMMADITEERRAQKEKERLNKNEVSARTG